MVHKKRSRELVENPDHNTIFKEPIYAWLNDIKRKKRFLIWAENYLVPGLVVLFVLYLVLKYALFVL